MTTLLLNITNNASDDPCQTSTTPFELYTRYLTSIIGSLIAGVGTLCNILAFFVFLVLPNRKPSHLFLMALAVFDVFVLVCYHLVYAVQLISEYVDDAETYGVWATYVPFVFPFSRFSQMCTIYIVIATALERVVTLANYTVSQRVFSNRNVLLWIALIVVLSFGFNACRHWEVYYMVNPNCTGILHHVVQPSSLVKENQLYRKLYSVWLSSIVLIIFPFIILAILAILNFILYNRAMSSKMLEAMYRSTVEAASRTRQLRDGTRVMLTLVVTYLIFNSLGIFLAMWEFVDIYTLTQRYTQFYTVAVELINMGAVTNSGCRIANYLIFNHEFRDKTQSLFCFESREPSTVRDIVKETIPSSIAVAANYSSSNKVEITCRFLGKADGDYTDPIFV